MAKVPEPTGLDRWSRSAVLSLLKRLSRGRLQLSDVEEERTFGDPSSDEVAELRVLDPRFYREIALGSSLGAGDAYVKGYWQTDDLLTLMRVFAKNLTQQNDLQTVALPLQVAVRKLLQWSNRNNKSGSRRNIARHYDLSNELFAAFLDPTMTYSCGIFPSDDATLEAASIEKYDRICQKLSLGENDRVVEIGCGWGGFAEHAAYNYGCRVTGITISREQLEFARERIDRAGLASRVELKLCDYRDLEGTFDKLVSIEMIEAVGHEYLGAFFAKCGQVLRPDGQMLLQAITLPDDRYDYYRKSVDFIQKYIFPGGCLPCLGRISNVVSEVTDMRITQLEDFAADYARTLLAWREAFFASVATIDALGFDEQFRRTWDYYFCYCAAGFLERQIGVSQILMKRPEAQ
ncbi:MAG: cyclopropane-fatty-acyl-phospholipid synthase family protein [Planctomycetota bacterium]